MRPANSYRAARRNAALRSPEGEYPANWRNGPYYAIHRNVMRWVQRVVHDAWGFPIVRRTFERVSRMQVIHQSYRLTREKIR